MNYGNFLRQAGSCNIEPIKLESGVTQGFLKTNQCSQPAVLPVRDQLGTDYALKYRLQDEDQQEDEESNYLEEVEGLTSMTGTLPNLDDVLSEQLTQVYDLYQFNNKTNNSNLAIHGYKDEILENMELNAVILIKGETGCGKTTQVPQMILDNARELNVHCSIVVTQPRRIATISVANRVAAERNWGIGSIVGYQVSLEKKVSPDTRLLYCTTGVLLQQLIIERSLSRYTHIVIDEVHERDIETDFLLVLVKRFLKDLSCRTKIILMSATVNTEKFTEYFIRRIRGFQIEPPVIALKKCLTNFPVNIYYLEDLEVGRLPMKIPTVKYDEPKVSSLMMELAASLVEVFYTIDQYERNQGTLIGSVLIFLPGYHEIEEMYDCLMKRKQRNKGNEEWLVQPLHSSVTFEQQVSVFQPPPPNCRKIILATNIAESSITVPDVKYVIDFCLMKYLKQEVDSGYSSLQVNWMSKSQGAQRAGRVGRVMPGRVYRLISKSLFEMLPKDCEPDMKISPLDVIVLKSKQLAPDSAPAKILAFAMDPPDLSNIYRTILSLKQAGALTTHIDGEYFGDDGELTYIGQVMASLPLDPALSKLIIMGHQFSLLRDAVLIACTMTARNIFSTPFKQQLEAYNFKIAWADSSCSDPIAFKIAYEVWRRKTVDGSYNRSGGLKERDLGERYFVQIKSLREAYKLEIKIMQRLKSLNIVEPVNPTFRWSDMEKPLILKIMIAGAFYPNYFLRKQIDEREAVKILGGRDPFSTCYLTGFPLNQPGPLYAGAIQKYFTHCGSDIHVSFDGSSKVYLEFKNSASDMDTMDNPARMPGCIQMALYRAIKIRQLKHVISLPLLQHHAAQKRWEAICQEQGTAKDGSRAKDAPHSMDHLLGHTVETLAVNISHKENPSKFWVQICDETNQMRLYRIYQLLNRRDKSESLIPITKKLEIGMLVAAPYSENKKECSNYYRARIRNLGFGRTVQVFFIDYGNTEWIDASLLRDFHLKLIQLNINDPEIAMECTLTEVQPSVMCNRNGLWSQKAIHEFEEYFGLYADPMAIAKVYSVVNGVVSVILFKNPGPAKLTFEFEDSFNYHLIKRGFADLCEEPYLSRENHLLRETAKKRPDLARGFSLEAADSSNYVQPPNESECRERALLKGPHSPLEMQLYCMTQKCMNKNVIVDWTSVNSVLLDTYPMDTHERILVAGLVNQSPNGEKLILRQTTLMPNIHGLFAIISLLFAPFVELRVNADRTRWTGALCGLGFDSVTKESYDPENDMEINFDVIFTYEDLENINKLRYWMNLIVFGGLDWQKELYKGQVSFAQENIKELLTKVLLKKRSSQGVLGNTDSFRWGLVNEKWLLCPTKDDEYTKPSLYPFIWAVSLKKSSSLARVEVTKNLDKLQAVLLGLEQLKMSMSCELCHTALDDLQSVRLHLSSSMHREALTEYKKYVPSN